MTYRQTLEELQRQFDEREAEFHAKAIADFPFERVETTGELALATWQDLKSAGRGYPVVLGDDRSVALIMEAFGDPSPHRTVAEIVAAADGLRHPEDLIARRDRDRAEVREHFAQLIESQPALSKMFATASGGPPRQLTQEDSCAARMMFEQMAALAGDWAAEATRRPGLSVNVDSVTGKPSPKVHIALIPTDDWTTVPAHLLWGGWNACPHPEYHVAALRSWRDRFGAELVGLSHDRMDLTVKRRPATYSQALDLVQEQQVYCGDILAQRMGTPPVLAEELMVSDWWDFWWD